MRNNPFPLALLSGLAVAFLVVVAGSPVPPQGLALAAPLLAPTPEVALGTGFAAVAISPPADSNDQSGVATTATPTPEGRDSDVVATVAVAASTGVSPSPEATGLFPDRPPVTPVPPARPYQLGGVPILMYHYIRLNPVATDAEGFKLSVTPADFRQQMRFLRNHGYSPVSIADVREYVRNKTPLPAKPIAITFDDGYADAYTEVLPTLMRFHLTATFYIVTGFVDRSRYLTWEQVATLERAGMEIASHTVHHRSLTVLGALVRQAELDDSRSELERRLGHAVLDFCYPGGQIDVPSELAVARAGYLSATTTAFGRPDIGDDPMRLPRLRAWGGESLATFGEILGETPNPADFRSIDMPK